MSIAIGFSRKHLEESLIGTPDIYFEAGDHVALIHLTGKDFHRLMANAPRARSATTSSRPLAVRGCRRCGTLAYYDLNLRTKLGCHKQMWVYR
jgi:hypothetical protein